MAASVPNAGVYLGSIGNMLTTIRDYLQKIIDQNNYIASMGGVTFLTAQPPNGLGMATADANALIATMGNMTNVAKGYQGGPPAPQLDYKSNSSPFWGGN